MRPSATYTHHQGTPPHAPGGAWTYAGPAALKPGQDDHHSPVKPDTYIALRLAKMMLFYQRRLPMYSRLRFALRAIVLLCTSAAAVL